jgi:hypothetical protein
VVNALGVFLRSGSEGPEGILTKHLPLDRSAEERLRDVCPLSDGRDRQFICGEFVLPACSIRAADLVDSAISAEGAVKAGGCLAIGCLRRSRELG